MRIKLVVILFAIGVLCSACGSDSEPSAQSRELSVNDSSQGNSVSSSSSNVESLAKAKPWRGSPAGYVHSAQDADDRIQLFIAFGKLMGAATAYHERAGEMRRMNSISAEQKAAGHTYLATLFDSELLDSYQAVDPMLQTYNKSNNKSLDIQSTLIGLNEAQQIADISNGDRNRREEQYAAQQKVLLVSSRVRDAVLAFFPSRHEYLLASSALIREAGDKVALAVSASGVILHPELLGEASALIDRSVKLNPGNVLYCDAQRVPMTDHKKAINTLLDSMVPNRLGQKLTITASDVYKLAAQAHQSGKGFPLRDGSNCP